MTDKTEIAQSINPTVEAEQEVETDKPVTSADIRAKAASMRRNAAGFGAVTLFGVLNMVSNISNEAVPQADKPLITILIAGGAALTGYFAADQAMESFQANSRANALEIIERQQPSSQIPQ